MQLLCNKRGDVRETRKTSNESSRSIEHGLERSSSNFNYINLICDAWNVGCNRCNNHRTIDANTDANVTTKTKVNTGFNTMLNEKMEQLILIRNFQLKLEG